MCSYTEAITETGKYHNTKNASGQKHLLRLLFSLPRIRNLKSKLLVLCFLFQLSSVTCFAYTNYLM